MRRIVSVLIVSIVLGSTQAGAQQAKQVEVINQPLAVEVVNPPAAPLPARFQLVGFTSATHNGDMGGHFGATQKCQIDFPDSRMCTTLEAQQATSLPAVLPDEAWVNVGGRLESGLISDNTGKACLHWTSINDSGRSLLANGKVRINVGCGQALPIACCGWVP